MPKVRLFKLQDGGFQVVVQPSKYTEKGVGAGVAKDTSEVASVVQSLLPKVERMTTATQRALHQPNT